jgi:hypothetical protein
MTGLALARGLCLLGLDRNGGIGGPADNECNRTVDYYLIAAGLLARSRESRKRSYPVRDT